MSMASMRSMPAQKSSGHLPSVEVTLSHMKVVKRRDCPGIPIASLAKMGRILPVVGVDLVESDIIYCILMIPRGPSFAVRIPAWIAPAFTRKNCARRRRIHREVFEEDSRGVPATDDVAGPLLDPRLYRVTEDAVPHPREGCVEYPLQDTQYPSERLIEQ